MGLIKAIQNLLCSHTDCTEEEKHVTEMKPDGIHIARVGIKVFRRCKKCGWHENYWKFLAQ